MPTWHNAGCKETQLGHFILRRGIAELRRRIFSALNTAWMPVGSDLCGYPVTIGASPMSGPMEARNVSSTQAESACRQSTRHSQGWRKLLSAHIKQQWGIIFDFGFAHAPGHLARRDALAIDT